MSCTKYELNDYTINIGFTNKNNILLMVINNLNNNKYSLILDKYNDCTANTNCENNVTLDLQTDIYDFIINCLEKKPYYNIKTKLIEDNDDQDLLYLTFSFVYETFNFEYTLNLFPK
jgi:hypothetical protein